MSKRKEQNLTESIFGLAGLILFAYYLTDRTKFWLLLVAAIVVISAISFFIARQKMKKFNNFNQGNDLLTRLRQMKPTEFEIYIADLYASLGYETAQIGGAYDGGIDVVATKNGIKHFIQCKKFITRQVGVGDIRNFYGAMAANLSNAKGIFITTNIFTTEAEKFAEDKPIELVDGNKLLKIIKLADNQNTSTSPKKKQDYNACPRCGKQLVKRTSKFGEFIGCSGYPACNYKKQL